MGVFLEEFEIGAITILVPAFLGYGLSRLVLRWELSAEHVFWTPVLDLAFASTGRIQPVVATQPWWIWLECKKSLRVSAGVLHRSVLRGAIERGGNGGKLVGALPTEIPPLWERLT
jgi:hypothetical protein